MYTATHELNPFNRLQYWRWNPSATSMQAWEWEDWGRRSKSYTNSIILERHVWASWPIVQAYHTAHAYTHINTHPPPKRNGKKTVSYWNQRQERRLGRSQDKAKLPMTGDWLGGLGKESHIATTCPRHLWDISYLRMAAQSNQKYKQVDLQSFKEDR